MALSGQVVLGIDTHKATHVAAVLDSAGRLSGLLEFAATDAGTRQLLTWARTYGHPSVAGVEGTGSYGYQLTRGLQRAGINVVEVNRPDRTGGDVAARATPLMLRRPRAPSSAVMPQRHPRIVKGSLVSFVP